MKLKKTWIVLADGAKAIVFCQKGEGEAIDQIGKLESAEAKLQTHEIGVDRPGRSFESMSSGRSAVEQTDFHNLAKERFAQDIADWLYRNESEFDRLILAAAPKTLGELRTILHKNVQGKIVKEVNKDLTTTPDQNLGEELQRVLQIAV